MSCGGVSEDFPHSHEHKCKSTVFMKTRTRSKTGLKAVGNPQPPIVSKFTGVYVSFGWHEGGSVLYLPCQKWEGAWKTKRRGRMRRCIQHQQLFVSASPLTPTADLCSRPGGEGAARQMSVWPRPLQPQHKATSQSDHRNSLLLLVGQCISSQYNLCFVPLLNTMTLTVFRETEILKSHF